MQMGELHMVSTYIVHLIKLCFMLRLIDPVAIRDPDADADPIWVQIHPSSSRGTHPPTDVLECVHALHQSVMVRTGAQLEDSAAKQVKLNCHLGGHRGVAEGGHLVRGKDPQRVGPGWTQDRRMEPCTCRIIRE